DVLLGRSTSRAPLPEHKDEDKPADDEEEEEPAKLRRPARRRQGARADIGLNAESDEDEDPVVHDTVVLQRDGKVPATRKTPDPPEHSPLPTRAEQLDISAAPGDYRLPPPHPLGKGTAA